MKTFGKWFAAAVVVGVLAGCARTAPIAEIHTTVSAGHTESQVRNAILQAGAQRKWSMSDAGPGVIKGRRQNRNHVAEVRITYSATGYAINYDNSLKLKASGGRIHKIYNRWVHNLDKVIRVKLSASPV